MARIRLRVCLSVGGLQEDLFYAGATLRDLGLAADRFVVFGTSVDGYVCERRGQDLAAHGEDAARLMYGFLEVPCHAGHGDDEKVAKAVPVEARSFVEAVLEEARHQWLRLRQRRDTVAQVAWRQDAQMAAQPAGGAAVVADRDDRGEVACVLLEAAQQDG